MTWRGIFTGSLALIALQAVLQTPESAGRVGGLLKGLADLFETALSPSVALVPDLAGIGTSAYGGQAGGGGSHGPQGFGGGGGGGAGGGGSW